MLEYLQLHPCAVVFIEPASAAHTWYSGHKAFVTFYVYRQVYVATSNVFALLCARWVISKCRGESPLMWRNHRVMRNALHRSGSGALGTNQRQIVRSSICRSCWRFYPKQTLCYDYRFVECTTTPFLTVKTGALTIIEDSKYVKVLPRAGDRNTSRFTPLGRPTSTFHVASAIKRRANVAVLV